MTDNLTNALKAQKKSTEQVNQQISGMLGIPLDGDRRVEVPNRNAYVYVRLRNNQSEVIQAYNNQVSPSYNLPVLVERQGNRYVVVSIDTQRYENNWSSFASFLPRHGNTHSFNMESGGGADIVWVESKQLMPLLSFPSGSNGAMNVLVAPYTLKNDDGTWKYVGNTGTSDLTLYLPTGSTAVMGLVYVDSVSGNPYFTINSGTHFSNTITGSSQVYPYIPRVTNPNTQIPIAGIRLVTGTSEISWDNIYDVRQWLHTQPTGSAGSGLSSVNIQDEGSPAGTATTFNFVGSNVHTSVSGSVVRVFVTGSAAAGFSGDANSVVLTNGAGSLDTMPWLKWGTDANEFIEFGADEAGKEANAGRMGYNFLGNGHFDMVGAGTGVGVRTFKMYDKLIVGESIETQSYNLAPGGTYNVTGSPHVHAGEVTNGNSHDHLGGDGGTVAYSSLGGALTQAAGTYTPLLTGTANVDAHTVPGPFTYMRVGNMVTVAGNLQVDPTAATTTTVGIPLPIASDFTAATDGSGNGAASVPNTVSNIIADATNNRMTMTFIATSTVNTGWRVMWMYEIK